MEKNNLILCAILLIVAIGACSVVAFLITEDSDDSPTPKSGDTLIIFFSRNGENDNVGDVEIGNTEVLVNYIAEAYGFDVFKIDPVDPYPRDYDENIVRVEKERADNARPEFKGVIENFDSYENIILAYPIWYETLPPIMLTLLDNYDFSGKSIYAFSTHEGSGLADTISVINENEPDATIEDTFSMRGRLVRSEYGKIMILGWIHSTGLMKSDSITSN